MARGERARTRASWTYASWTHASWQHASWTRASSSGLAAILGSGGAAGRVNLRAAVVAGGIVAGGIVAIVAGGGCAPKVQRAGDGGAAVAAADPRSPEVARAELAEAERALAEVIARHNARTARLETFESRASLELRYADRDGEHFDQCEADIFLASGGRGAVRATKVGNNLLWVGSDGAQGWMFRLDREPTSLTVFNRVDDGAMGELLAGVSGGGAAGGAAGTEGFALLAPQSVRLLAGLRAIEAPYAVRPVDGADLALPVAERHEVVVRAMAGLDVAVRFGRDGLPATVTASSPSGARLLTATLGEYESAQAANIAQGAWPKVPRRIAVTADQSKVGGGAVAGGSKAEVRIYLDAPVAMAKRMKPKFFVLADLVALLRPDSVQHVISVNGAPDDGAGGAPVGSAAGSSGASGGA